MPSLLIYGASGYTGRLASLHAKRLGLDFIIAGHTNGTHTEAFALQLNVAFRLFDVTNPKGIDAALGGAAVLLNCAGPFMNTAKPLMSACIRNGVHYLDISAELNSYQLAEDNDQIAKEANVMLLPGCGGSVAMLGCLVGKVTEKVKTPIAIDVALSVAGSMSRGSIISASGSMSTEILERRNNEVAKREDVGMINLDFGNGKGSVANYPVTLPDIITIWKATGVRNIRTYVHLDGDAFPASEQSSIIRSDGPTEKEREASPYHAAVAVTAEDGTTTHAVLHTVNGYTFTGLASAEAAGKVLAGVAKPGFQTPALLFGNDFIQTIGKSEIMILQDSY